MCWDGEEFDLELESPGALSVTRQELAAPSQ
jgi:hypothetical protein